MLQRQDPLSFFATAAKGTEVALRDELRRLRFRGVRADRGGVHFSGSLEEGYRACVTLRTALRVLWQLDAFDAPDEASLYEGVRAIDWSPFVTPDRTLAVRAASKKSRLTHTQFIAQKTKDAIVDRMREERGARSSVDKDDPDLVVFIRLDKDVCTLYADLSGRALFARGYRTEQLVAPLKETLAASCLFYAGFDGSGVFTDPMCGSGTIAIEAAMIARNISPGLLNPEFGFMRWPRFDATERDSLDGVLGDARARVKDDAPPCFASDVDEKALEITRRNARRAGVSVRTIRGDVGKFIAHADGETVVTNPPYGERLARGTVDLNPLVDAVVSRTGTAAILTASPDALREVRLRSAHRFELWNGDIACELAVYQRSHAHAR